MPKVQKDQLFILVKSLTKSEKRNFKLYASRSQSGGDSKFLQLFDALDRMSHYDDKVIIKKVASIEKRHLSNLKRHLYKQILTSLRLIYIQKNIDIQIREQLDFARILYGKGMYMQSLRLLERIKNTAVDHHQDVLHLEILEFQKLIESRHVTHSRQVENKMERLLMESLRRSQITHDINLLSALNIQIHGYYIQSGHATKEEDRHNTREFFSTHMPDGLDHRQLTFFEKANLYQSWMWLHYINMNLAKAKESAAQWVNLFVEDPRMSEKDPDLYIRSIYYLLMLLFLNQDKADFSHYHSHLNDFIDSTWEDLNDNSRMLAEVYRNLSLLNSFLLYNDFQAGIEAIPAIQKSLAPYENYMDEYRSLLFEFKFAYLHFGVGDFDKALDFLNNIILIKNAQLPKDLQIYATLLQIKCLYETGQYDLMAYFISPLSRLINKYPSKNKTQLAILNFLKKLAMTPPAEAEQLFLAFSKHIAILRKDPFETKALYYLRPELWIKSQLENRTVQEASFELEKV